MTETAADILIDTIHGYVNSLVSAVLARVRTGDIYGIRRADAHGAAGTLVRECIK